MKHAPKMFAALAAFSLIAAASAQNVTGVWKGKVDFDMSSLPKGQNAEQQKQMVEAVKKMMGNMTMKLTLNANKTFTMVVTGIPQMGGANAPKQKDQTAKGTWTQKGNALTLKITEANGEKPKGDNQPQTLTISKDGKSMTMVPKTPGAQMGKSKIVFTR